jgi:hypothetical protein
MLVTILWNGGTSGTGMNWTDPTNWVGGVTLAWSLAVMNNRQGVPALANGRTVREARASW